jgi:hypothetical protein
LIVVPWTIQLSFERNICTINPCFNYGEYGSVQTSKTWRFINFTFIRSFRNSFPSINVVYGRGREVAAPIMKSGKVAVLALIETVHQQSPCKTNTLTKNRLRLILGLEAKILQ